MLSTLTSRFGRRVRSAAFDVLAHRDGNTGWKPGRAAFYADKRLDAPGLAQVAEQRLENVLRHAFRTTDHYAQAMRGAGIRDADGIRASDLDRLPFVTKDIVRNQRERLRSHAFTLDALVESATGGTTGTQTKFWMDKRCALTRVGRQWGVLSHLGYSPGMRRGLVWGAHVDVAGDELGAGLKRRFRRFASGDEVLYCAVMSDSQLREYHARLLAFRPQVLYGYPSALARFAAFIEDNKLARIRTGRIFTTAERLTDQARALLGTTFGGEVFNLYCSREYGCVAFECANHRGMHIDTGSVRLELCDASGNIVPSGTSGEIVVTDLCNYGMPLIRSRTGDFATFATTPCDCGLPFPRLQQLDGRSTETIHLPDGSTVSGLMLADLFMDLPMILIAQFVQDERERLRILLVMSTPLNDALETSVIEETRTIVGNEIEIEVNQVSDLPRNPRSGKIPEVVGNYRPEANRS